MNWWWISFLNSDRPTGQMFTGVCIVEGNDFGEALTNSWAHNCNPGGEAQGMQLEVPPDPKHTYRLLTMEMLEEYDLI